MITKVKTVDLHNLQYYVKYNITQVQEPIYKILVCKLIKFSLILIYKLKY